MLPESEKTIVPDVGYSRYESAIGAVRRIELVISTETESGSPAVTLDIAEIARAIPGASPVDLETDAVGFVFGWTVGGREAGMSDGGSFGVVEAVFDDGEEVDVRYVGPLEEIGGPLLPPLPLVETPPEEPDELAGRQAVCTTQCVQSKVMMPKTDCATVLPWKMPLPLIVTPEKLIQPVFSPHGYPPRTPCRCW
jgi:hypothetical protein